MAHKAATGVEVQKAEYVVPGTKDRVGAEVAKLAGDKMGVDSKAAIGDAEREEVPVEWMV